MITDQWVLERRGPKANLDADRPYAAVLEEELDASGVLAPTAVVFITNRECPFRCVMCDLWRNTLDDTVPPGAISTQIRDALRALAPARQIKLYNAGSFFDPAAIPPSDDDEIAQLVAGFERVVVEAHPGFLIGAYAERCLRFRDRLRGFRLKAEATISKAAATISKVEATIPKAEATKLEVAIGLETAHPETLARLNKRMTIESFQKAAAFLAANEIDLRVFILLNPPFLKGQEAVEWACRSIDLAANCGASVCSVIPTRSGNGAMEALGDDVQPPRLPALERVLEYGISTKRLRVFADLWDVEQFFDCECSPARRGRLHRMNRTQTPPPPVSCQRCSFGSSGLGVGS